MDANSTKRKHGAPHYPNKSQKTDDGPKKMSFGEKMLARMGHKAGSGLGREGTGIVNPISVQVRPAGVGLGAVKEKSAETRREEKRQAAANGTPIDSESDSESRTRGPSKKNRGHSGFTPKRPKKPTYQTAESNGLHIPASFQTILDATSKTITDTSTLRLRGEIAVPDKARLTVESYADNFNQLCEEEKLLDVQEMQFEAELAQLQTSFDQALDIQNAAVALKNLELGATDSKGVTFNDVVLQLQRFQDEYLVKDSRKEFQSVFVDLAVALLVPPLKSEIRAFDPVENPMDLRESLQSLEALLRIHDEDRRKTTPFQTMMHTYVLPKLRKVVIGGQYGFEAGFAVLSEWKDLLPPWMYKNLLDQAILNLSNEIARWKPQSNPMPYIWVLPWLEHIPQHHASSLLSQLKEKVGLALRTCNLSDGPPPGLKTLSKYPKQFEQILIRHLLPRLATLLRDWEIDPSNQDLAILEAVLAWSPPLRSDVMGQLIAIELQPKYLEILHLWLTADEVNYSEVGQWYAWFKTLFSEKIRNVRVVADMFDKGLEMINEALDLGYEAKSKLQLRNSALEAPETPKPSKDAGKEPPRSVRKEVEEATFKDVVDTWCGEENLLLIPLRAAHETTGLPLFRITASATGRGGVMVYMKGDVLYAQNKKDKSLWEPIGLESDLVHRAEGN